MGKNIIPQKRGKGGSVYRSPSHRHLGDIKLPHPAQGEGLVREIVHAPGRTSPLAWVDFEGEEALVIAPDGLSVGQRITVGGGSVGRGNISPLSLLPEGTLVYDIELHPGDGGKLCRAAGATAVVVSQGPKTVVQLPSGTFRALDPRCRAAIGVVAGAGQGEQPFTKAGKKFHAYRSRAKAPFKVRGVAMNVVSHPHGGGSHQHVGHPSTVAYNAPPGRKVGRLSPKPKRVKDKIRRR